MLIRMDKWLTKPCAFHSQYNKGNPVPLRQMKGGILRESEKMYLIEVYGFQDYSDSCLVCGGVLKSEESKELGVGNECLLKIGVNRYQFENDYYLSRAVGDSLSNLHWCGWVPKDNVRIYPEKVYMVITDSGLSKNVSSTSDLKMAEKWLRDRGSGRVLEVYM